MVQHFDLLPLLISRVRRLRPASRLKQPEHQGRQLVGHATDEHGVHMHVVWSTTSPKTMIVKPLELNRRDL